MTTDRDLEELHPLPPPDGKSKVELIKESSRGLRGTIAEELHDGKPGFSSDNVQLLKFHGMYQQEDRDFRKSVRQEIGAVVRTEKAHSFMIRTKVPGGVLTADQYLVHDEISGRYANGTLRITTRQDVQFHGVLKGKVKKSLKALNEKLITTIGACGDIERNVMFCPVPERDALRKQLLAQSLELSNRLLPTTGAYAEIWLDGEKAVEIPEPDPTYGTNYMPRKFKSGMAYPRDNCIDVYSQDLGIVPEVSNGMVVGYTILIGGGLGMTHRNESTFPRLGSPVAFVEPEHLIDTCLAVVAIQREYGNRKDRKQARLKYLVEQWGVPRFRAEMSRRLGLKLEDGHDLEWDDAYDHLGWNLQGDGNLYLGIYVENGRVLDDGRLRMRTGFRKLVEELRPGVALTPQQNVLFTDIPPSRRDRVNEILGEHGVPFVEDLSNALRYSMACPAMPTCGLAIAEAERALPSLIREIEAELERQGLADDIMSVRMTGCPNGCARPYIGDIGIVGRSLNQYVVYLGGDFEGTRLNREYADLVAAAEIVPLLRPVFALFKARRQEGETFGNFCNRVGVESIREMVGAPVAT
jgi:sulfite reductase (ferredoxin)